MKRRKDKPKIKQDTSNGLQLTPDQLRQIFFAKCMDRDHLHEWVRLFWGVNLPRFTVSRYSNCNPLQSVWEMYSICVHEKKGTDTLYIAPRGGGKCVAKGTLIPVKGHGLRAVENVKAGDEVYSGFGWRTVLQTFDEGNKESYEVVTKNGVRVAGSVNHRIMVASQAQGIEWKHLSDLKPGDYAYLAAPNDLEITSAHDFDSGWLIGAIIGDGSIVNTVKNRRVDFCSGDDVVAARYCKLMKERFNKAPRVWRNSPNSNGYQVNSSSLVSWLHEHIDGRLAYDKKLKKLDHSDSFLAGFIVGLFDTDGSKDEITLANKELVEQISAILTRFGVFNRIIYERKKPRFSAFTNSEVHYHSVHFISRLPRALLPLGRKADAFLRESEKRREQYRYPSFTVEFFVKELRDAYQLANGWITLDGNKQRVVVPFADQLSYRGSFIEGHKIKAWSSWADELGLKKLAERLRLVHSGYFQEIVETNKSEAYFYDLEVQGDHSYVSNGIVSHNTLGVAIAESALMFHDRRGVVHVGAIEKQAKRAYSYFQNFVAKNKAIVSPMIDKSTIEKTLAIVDNEQVSLECLPCTMTALNGPHEACVVMDELDTLSPEGLLAYKQINGIPVKHRLTGAPPIKIGISTRKSAYGLVQKQMDLAQEQGRLVKIWNQIDLMEKCQPDRHGTQEVTIYVDQMKMHHLPQSEYDKLTEDKKKDYVAYPATDGCLKCPLFSVCLGDAKNQDPSMTPENSTMIASIDEVVRKVKGADVDWVLAEMMCLKPSVEGIVFKEFDKSRHALSWEDMWLKLTKEKPTGPVGEMEFIRELHRRKVPVYAGVDFGWTAPSTVIFSAVDQDDNVYVLRTFGVTKTNDPTFINLIKTKFHRFYKVQMYYPDVANGSAVDLMKAAGLPVASKIDKSENLGVQVIKRAMNVPGTSESKFFIAKETSQQLIYELERYHYEKDASGTVIDGKFAKEFDHSIDGLRYTLTAILGKARFVVAGDNAMTALENPLLDSNGSFLRAPNFYELAQQHNVPVTPPSARPFDKSDEEDGPDGFLWSF